MVWATVFYGAHFWRAFLAALACDPHAARAVARKLPEPPHDVRRRCRGSPLTRTVRSRPKADLRVAGASGVSTVGAKTVDLAPVLRIFRRARQ